MAATTNCPSRILDCVLVVDAVHAEEDQAVQNLTVENLLQYMEAKVYWTDQWLYKLVTEKQVGNKRAPLPYFIVSLITGAGTLAAFNPNLFQ
jgi:hypothetical protein